MKFRDDYARANVPMLPVVASPVEVTRKIVGYSYAMVVATLALAPYAGWLYTTAAVALGAWFLLAAHRLHAQVRSVARDPDPAAHVFPMRLFHLSIAYLTLLFVAIAVSALLPVGHW
jgi:heme o synthase